MREYLDEFIKRIGDDEVVHEYVMHKGGAKTKEERDGYSRAANRILDEGLIIRQGQTLRVTHEFRSIIDGEGIHAYFAKKAKQKQREESKQFWDYINSKTTFWMALAGIIISLIALVVSLV